MTVYVDETQDWTRIAKMRGLRHTHWCHLTADTEEELHAFAGRLSLRRSWFQKKSETDYRWHYDIVPSKRAEAVRLGAQEVDRRFIGQLMIRRQRERDGITGEAASVGPRCGNNPNVRISEGDQRVIDEFRAHLTTRTAVRPYRILVTGSRDWTDEASVWRALADVIREKAPADARIVVVHGACPTGADRHAAQWCAAAISDGRRSVEEDSRAADWDHCTDRCPTAPGHRRFRWAHDTAHPGALPDYCPSAGPRRNAELVQLGADCCLAFLNPCANRTCTRPRPHPSHGAGHTASLAERVGIPVLRYTP